MTLDAGPSERACQSLNEGSGLKERVNDVVVAAIAEQKKPALTFAEWLAMPVLETNNNYDFQCGRSFF